VYRAVRKVPSVKHGIVQVTGSVRFLLPLPFALQYVLIIMFQFNPACTWSSNSSSSPWTVFQSNFCRKYIILFRFLLFVLFHPVQPRYLLTFKGAVVTISAVRFNIPIYTMFCPQSVFICFAWISDQTAIISPYIVH
jgi:hypothetical protein